MTASTEPEQEHEPTVVVGVSPTSGSVAALRWGADEARRRGAKLVALRAWRSPLPPMTAGARPPAVSRNEDAELSDAMAELQDHVRTVLGDGVKVTCQLTHGSALSVLLQASKFATMLVLDVPQRTDFSQTPLLAHRLVYQAECPVLVMPPAVSDQPDTPFVRASKHLGLNVLKSAATAGRPGMRMNPAPADPPNDGHDQG